MGKDYTSDAGYLKCLWITIDSAQEFNQSSTSEKADKLYWSIRESVAELNGAFRRTAYVPSVDIESLEAIMDDFFPWLEQDNSRHLKNMKSYQDEIELYKDRLHQAQPGDPAYIGIQRRVA